MPIKQIVYNCKWCNRLKLATKERCLTHESHCFKNPKNKACLTCVFFKRRRRFRDEYEFSRGDIYECSMKKINFFRTHEQKIVNTDLNTKVVLKEVDELIFNSDKKMIFPKRDCDLYEKK